MEKQYGVFSKELEEQIASTVVKIVNSTAVEAVNNGGKRYMRKNELCEELNISFNSLRLWESMGLKTIQVVGISLIDRQDLNSFLEDHKI